MGYVGLGKVLCRIGDRVFIALGGNNPLIVRPASSVLGCYKLVGGSFIPGLEFGEGLLGPLPSSWSCSFVMRSGCDIPEFYGPSGEETQLDPRAGPILTGWEVLDAMGGTDKDQMISFKNYETEEETLRDPRLTSENLGKIGIELEDIILV